LVCAAAAPARALPASRVAARMVSLDAVLMMKLLHEFSLLI
jgi:hypothetical protein